MIHGRLFSRFKYFFISFFLLQIHLCLSAQETFPVNGVADPRERFFAFVHATIVQDGSRELKDATLVIREGKIITVGEKIATPSSAVVIDCSGKYITPSFIDIYSDYGIPIPQSKTTPSSFYVGATQMKSNTKGAFGWNEAIKAEVDGSKIFVADTSKAKSLRELGFGTVLTHQKDGIARGTGVVVTLANQKENLSIIKEKASAHYSLSKGSSTQSYPSSMMGTIALLRQTYLDAAWYKSRPPREGINLSLQAWLDNQNLVQIMEANDKWNDLRANRIAMEAGVHYIIKGGGNEYQRISEIAGMHAPFILPLNFPQAMDVEDPNEARFVSLADMKHWELAPTNPAAFEKAGIQFCITTSDLRDLKQFSANLRKAIEYGLSETKAFEALTKTPAELLHVYDKVGSLEVGKLANFLISTGPVLKEKSVIIENWVQGERYVIKDESQKQIKGNYQLVINEPEGQTTYLLIVKSYNDARVAGKDSFYTRFNFDGKLVNLSFSPGGVGPRIQLTDTSNRNLPVLPKTAREQRREGSLVRLSGLVGDQVWSGNGEDSSGRRITWIARLAGPPSAAPDTTKKKINLPIGKVFYPFNGYGWEVLPQQEVLLIKNATVWTNEKEGKLENTDVLVKNGKIVRIGQHLTDPSARQIDGTGKHLTPGIIDEHSHIASTSINEGAQSVTSEVRIGDNLNPEDINIYRELSGGVTSAHILHGSANTIGGQTQLIKLRWGVDDEGLKFKNWDPFIKFALGENVKRTTSPANNRFPDTRMGVEQVLTDAFTRARDYEARLKVAGTGKTGASVRRDLELDALVEVLQHKRFITCHSYVQSEIIMLMRVAEKFGFRVNTLTHILEGYKVADKIKMHGSSVSTFSDWWAYKMEVQDAIAYNATIMQKIGLNVCINSDDPEMARRLNQEAAKSVKYGAMDEEDALKMVTLNPARALHVEDRVGTIKEGKDADLVLWSDHPLSIYAKPLKTIVDGTIYYDVERDSLQRIRIREERNRLIQKLLSEKKSGSAVTPGTPSFEVLLSCGDHNHGNGLITYYNDGEDGGEGEANKN
ncbi:MAG: amidohydrolase [Bacteroidetes bacterium]|nr:MAG: amidohydrolase [Bacteroidota bacterium]